MGRSKNSQSKHDSEVKRLANKLLNQGYDVDADIKGFGQPKTLGGYIFGTGLHLLL